MFIGWVLLGFVLGAAVCAVLMIFGPEIMGIDKFREKLKRATAELTEQRADFHRRILNAEAHLRAGRKYMCVNCLKKVK